MDYAHTTGLVSGLMAALTWAVASVVFRKLGASLHPLTLNLYKGVIAIAILLVPSRFNRRRSSIPTPLSHKR